MNEQNNSGPNNTETKSRVKARRSRLSRQLLLQYFLSLIGYIGGLVLLAFLAWRFCDLFIWQDSNPLYRALQFVKEYIILFVGVPALAGWIVLTRAFMTKPLRYLDEVVAAAEQLTVAPTLPVRLPEAMWETQNELNLVRETALRDAAAAKEAEQRKNDLVVYLAHDLKTPLTSVIGYLTLLRDEPQISTELRAKYSGIALEKAERLEDLINEFFDVTRFNLTALTLETETVNLSRILEQIAFEFNPILADKELNWDMRLAPDLHILGDPDKLQRVFDNLLRNAVNYSYRGTTILLTLSQQDGSVLFRVQNQGKTIPPEKLEHLFEQFFRLDSSRTSITGGAGLGLAIAKEIVELHGGTIMAESADESITFTVMLPDSRQ